MANQITLGATLLFDGGDGTGGQPDNLSGVAAGTTDTSTFLQGSTSYTYSATNSRDGFLYDAGSAQDYSNNVFYLTVNSGVVGLLTDFRVRFCGATVTDYFEVEVGSSTSWPQSIQGGWVTFVVDIEEAKADAGRVTGGTEPATNAIRYVGFSQLLSVMPKMADNTWFDTLYRLPANTAAVIVEGRNGGTTDWNAADILTQLGTGQMFYYQGPGGSYVLTGPLQFGINDTSTHGFTDTNSIWLWDNQTYVADSFYSISALGNVGGTTNVTLGSKTGTGNDATGAQGLTIAAASAGARWAMDFDDPNLDAIGLYGCSFQHFATFELDTAQIEAISCLYIDGQKANVTNSFQSRNTIVNAATADGVAFMVTDDMGDIVNCAFNFSDGHAIELNAATPTSQNNVGNSFSGYTNTINSTDAAILNSAAGDLTINSSGGSNLQTNSYRNTGGGTVDIQNNISVTFTGLKDDTEVAVYNDATGALIAEAEPATGGSPGDRSFTFSAAAATVVFITVNNLGWTLPPRNRIDNFTVPSNDTSIPLTQVVDRTYSAT